MLRCGSRCLSRRCLCCVSILRLYLISGQQHYQSVFYFVGLFVCNAPFCLNRLKAVWGWLHRSVNSLSKIKAGRGLQTNVCGSVCVRLFYVSLWSRRAADCMTAGFVLRRQNLLTTLTSRKLATFVFGLNAAGVTHTLSTNRLPELNNIDCMPISLKLRKIVNTVT